MTTLKKQEVKKEGVKLSGYNIMASFSTTEGDPKEVPNTVFAQLMKKPGTLYSVAVGRSINGEEYVRLKEAVFLEAGFAHSTTGFDDAVFILGEALAQALAEQRSASLKDDGKVASIVLSFS